MQLNQQKDGGSDWRRSTGRPERRRSPGEKRGAARERRQRLGNGESVQCCQWELCKIVTASSDEDEKPAEIFLSPAWRGQQVPQCPLERELTGQQSLLPWSSPVPRPPSHGTRTLQSKLLSSNSWSATGSSTTSSGETIILTVLETINSPLHCPLSTEIKLKD